MSNANQQLLYQDAPGTEILVDQNEDNKEYLHGYQHVVIRRDTRILLVPQPSLNDPNDPLRWPQWKKWLTLFNGLFYSFNGAMTGPMMAGGMIGLSQFFQRPLSDISSANGATLICQGFGTLLWMPLAVKFGRRPVYLTSNVLMALACVWLAIAAENTYPNFVVARAFLGLWEAPIEAIVPCTITDMFYLHERGMMISIYGLSVLGGNELGPLLSAYIIQGLSMRWAFFIVAMIIGLSIVIMIFSMPETQYYGARPVIVPGESPPGRPEESLKEKSYIRNLAFCSTVEKQADLWKIFLRPVILVLYPTILWASVVYGMSLSWNVILGVLVAQLFSVEYVNPLPYSHLPGITYNTRPYNFSSGPQGLIFVSPLVGSLVGTYLCGPIADQVATFFTTRNHGIREPEMRLPTCIVAAVLTFLGALLSGLTYHYKNHWSAPIIGFGLLSAGAQMGATLAISYAVDCHPELSAELMVTISCLKSAVAWIWTWCINDWVTANGLLVVFCVLAAINVVVFGSTFIFYFRGKRVRIWIQEKDFMAHASA